MQIGSVVVLQDEPGLAIQEFMIAVSHRSDVTPREITEESPLGAALIGRKVGDVIARSRTYGDTASHQEIIEIRGASGEPPNRISQCRTKETEDAAAKAERARSERQRQLEAVRARQAAKQRAAEAERQLADERAAQAFAALPWWRKLVLRHGKR